MTLLTFASKKGILGVLSSKQTPFVYIRKATDFGTFFGQLVKISQVWSRAAGFFFLQDDRLFTSTDMVLMCLQIMCLMCLQSF